MDKNSKRKLMEKSIFLKLWGWPILLSILTLIGLIWALVKDGIVDFMSCLLLLIPLIIIIKYYYLKK